MAKKETNKTKDKGGFEIMGFSLEIPQESFDKLLLAMAEPKKKNQKEENPQGMMESLVGLRLNPLLSDITTLSDNHTESVTDFLILISGSTIFLIVTSFLL